jgi:hypothetical protein
MAPFAYGDLDDMPQVLDRAKVGRLSRPFHTHHSHRFSSSFNHLRCMVSRTIVLPNGIPILLHDLLIHGVSMLVQSFMLLFILALGGRITSLPLYVQSMHHAAPNADRGTYYAQT